MWLKIDESQPHTSIPCLLSSPPLIGCKGLRGSSSQEIMATSVAKSLEHTGGCDKS